MRINNRKRLEYCSLFKCPNYTRGKTTRPVLEKTKGEVGRDKIAVRKALYKAYMLGV